MRQAGFWEFGLDAAIRREFLAHPSAPRPKALRRMLRASYGSLSGRTMVAIALLLGVPLGLVEVFGGSTDRGFHLVVAAAALIFSVVTLIAPALPARRAAWAVERGVLGQAIVQDVRPHSRRDMTAVGRWHVNCGARSFDESFVVDGPLSFRLEAGDRVRLLVAPDRQASFFVLERISPQG